MAENTLAENTSAENTPCKLRPKETPVNLEPFSPGLQYSGLIIIRFDQGRPNGDPNGDSILEQINQPPFSELTSLRALADRTQSPLLSGLVRVIEAFDELPANRAIQTVSPEQILALEAKAAESKFPPIDSLTAYFQIDARQLNETQQVQLVQRLRQFPRVELAYRELVSGNPTFAGNAGNRRLGNQEYLNPAPLGIEALYTLGLPNGQGNGIKLVDLEQGWQPAHEDLNDLSPTVLNSTPIVGTQSPDANDINHGTSVLGIVAAVNNTVGGVGIAPGVAAISLASHHVPSTSTTAASSQVADAIAATIAHPTALDPGDVLLLEVHKSQRPAEIDPLVFDTIRLASALNIIVVEAAGNGGLSLDELADSGAIMVASATAEDIHAPYTDCGFGCDTNTGSRINCYAWGEFIDTATGSTDYNENFGGTSGAAAIIAGAALVVQGLYLAATSTRLSAAQMRAVLSDATTGTPSASPTTDNIGVMPNLRQIVASLGLTPNIYIRDAIGDGGDIPSTGSLGTSPDIIITPAPVANPTASFGSGSGTENSLLGTQVVAGQNNTVYVRVYNRGSSPATEVRATVYWSELTTLIDPAQWVEIGTSAPVTIPAHSGPIVLPAITWAAADVPGSGSYTFIAVIDSKEDPGPVTPTAPRATPADIDNFIRYQNNVATNSVTVVSVSARTVIFAFLVTGAADCDRSFDLCILQQLPPSASVTWRIPETLFERLPKDLCVETQRDPDRQQVQLKLPVWQSLSLKNVLLTVSSRYPTEFVIQGLDPDTIAQGNYSLSVCQLTNRREVGRLTWQLCGAQPKPKQPKQPSKIVCLLRWLIRRFEP